VLSAVGTLQESVTYPYSCYLIYSGQTFLGGFGQVRGNEQASSGRPRFGTAFARRPEGVASEVEGLGRSKAMAFGVSWGGSRLFVSMESQHSRFSNEGVAEVGVEAARASAGARQL